MFDEQPDGDLHGECAMEIDRLKDEVSYHKADAKKWALQAMKLDRVLGFTPVLDACCGPRMMWFDRSDERATFIDCRRETVCGAWGPASVGRRDVVIAPDKIADFTNLPFPDATFWHVVFDPPHIERTAATGKVSQTFGVLTPGWEDRLRQGFSECFRVLRPGGTLIFKWCEVEIPLTRVLALTQERPLYGHRSGAKARTHWIAFIKPNVPSNILNNPEQI